MLHFASHVGYILLHFASYVGTDENRSRKETLKVGVLSPKTTLHSGSLKNYRAGVRATFHQKYPAVTEQLRGCSNTLIFLNLVSGFLI